VAVRPDWFEQTSPSQELYLVVEYGGGRLLMVTQLGGTSDALTTADYISVAEGVSVDLTPDVAWLGQAP
jgi:hypothetical protein